MLINSDPKIWIPLVKVSLKFGERNRITLFVEAKRFFFLVLKANVCQMDKKVLVVDIILCA